MWRNSRVTRFSGRLRGSAPTTHSVHSMGGGQGGGLSAGGLRGHGCLWAWGTGGAAGWVREGVVLPLLLLLLRMRGWEVGTGLPGSPERQHQARSRARDQGRPAGKHDGGEREGRGLPEASRLLRRPGLRTICSSRSLRGVAPQAGQVCPEGTAARGGEPTRALLNFIKKGTGGGGGRAGSARCGRALAPLQPHFASSGAATLHRVAGSPVMFLVLTGGPLVTSSGSSSSGRGREVEEGPADAVAAGTGPSCCCCFSPGSMCGPARSAVPCGGPTATHGRQSGGAGAGARWQGRGGGCKPAHGCPHLYAAH